MRRLVQALFILAGIACHSAETLAQATADALEKEIVASWLVVVEGEARSRVLVVNDLTRRSDGSYILDAAYGWTIGIPSPVRVDLIQSPDSRKIITIRTQANSVLVAKEEKPGEFVGTFTLVSGISKNATITRSTDEAIRGRIEQEIVAARSGPGFADENKDWGVAPTSSAKRSFLGSPTPLSVPGAKTVTTIELAHTMTKPDAPIMVDVLDGAHITIPRVNWMPGAGIGAGAAENRRFAAAMEKLTGGDKSKPVVISSLSSQCWLSYNAAQLAVDLGYSKVQWYRGGVQAWRAAGLPTRKTEGLAW